MYLLHVQFQSELGAIVVVEYGPESILLQGVIDPPRHHSHLVKEEQQRK